MYTQIASHVEIRFLLLPSTYARHVTIDLAPSFSLGYHLWRVLRYCFLKLNRHEPDIYQPSGSKRKRDFDTFVLFTFLSSTGVWSVHSHIQFSNSIASRMSLWPRVCQGEPRFIFIEAGKMRILALPNDKIAKSANLSSNSEAISSSAIQRQAGWHSRHNPGIGRRHGGHGVPTWRPFGVSDSLIQRWVDFY